MASVSEQEEFVDFNLEDRERARAKARITETSRDESDCISVTTIDRYCCVTL